jgi:hypothetical protein
MFSVCKIFHLILAVKNVLERYPTSNVLIFNNADTFLTVARKYCAVMLHRSVTSLYVLYRGLYEVIFPVTV